MHFSCRQSCVEVEKDYKKALQCANNAESNGRENDVTEGAVSHGSIIVSFGVDQKQERSYNVTDLHSE